MNLLIEEQREFDREYFDPKDRYEGLNPLGQKADHINIHLQKITGRKLIHWAVQGWETLPMRNVVLEEVIPDLSIYRSQLVNMSEMAPEEVLSGAQALRPGILTVPKPRIHTELVRVGGYLADCIEPMRHGETAGLELVRSAATYLQFAVESAGVHYGLTTEDIEEMHSNRLDIKVLEAELRSN